MKTFKRLGINVTRSKNGWWVGATEYTNCNKGEAVYRYLHAYREYKEGKWQNSSS